MDSDVFAVTDGVLVTGMSPEHWEKLKAYPLRHDDVILSSFPRSGSTWMQHIIRLLRNGGKDDGVNLDDAVPLLDALGTHKGNLLKLNPNAVEELTGPRSLKVHLPYYMTPGGTPHTTKAKYIYIARNPKDVCVSHWNFSQTQLTKFAGESTKIPWETYIANFLEVKSLTGVYGGWMKHVLEWWGYRDEPNVLFLKYEDVKKEPRMYVQTIAEFMDIKDVTPELVDRVLEQSSFPKMRENPTVNNRIKEGASFGLTFLRKGIVGDWKNYFTEEQNLLFEENILKKLREQGLEFEYEQ